MPYEYLSSEPYIYTGPSMLHQQNRLVVHHTLFFDATVIQIELAHA